MIKPGRYVSTFSKLPYDLVIVDETGRWYWSDRSNQDSYPFSALGFGETVESGLAALNREWKLAVSLPQVSDSED